jgi:hypothetical protein
MAKKSKAKAARSKTVRKPGRSARKAKAAKRATRATAKKPKQAARSAKSSARRRPARTATRRPKGRAAKPARKAPAAKPARKTPQERAVTASGKRPNLDRERRTIREEEMVPSPPSSLNMDRTASAARSGRAEFEHRLREHTSTGPALTGGDVDADWEGAETVGDEAPGGDNPTPDQDVVDEIGHAMGIEYDDDEELQGGDELSERDRHRWELDPASKEEFEDE